MKALHLDEEAHMGGIRKCREEKIVSYHLTGLSPCLSLNWVPCIWDSGILFCLDMLKDIKFDGLTCLGHAIAR